MIHQHLLWLAGTLAERTAYDTTPLQPPVLWYETDTDSWYYWTGAAWTELGGGGGTPDPHAASHQHGGADEVATATPGANAIPKADATGTLDGWISEASKSGAGIAELATEGEAQAGIDAGRVITPATLAAVFRQPAPLVLDFTGTAFDTKAKCQTLGLRFSDDDEPFPETLLHSVSGSFSHSATAGWRPTAPVNDEGPALLLPLARPGNWELEIVLNYNPAGASDQGRVYVGYLASTNHVGAAAMFVDAWNAAYDMRASLTTNNGDDTLTTQYTGTILSGTGLRTLRFRCENGAVGVWDPQGSSWHYYEGRQSAGIAYTAACAFVQFYKYDNTNPFWNVYLDSLKLTYLT